MATTDTLQRRQSSFATATDLYGPLLAATEDYPSPRRRPRLLARPAIARTPRTSPTSRPCGATSGDARATASSTLAEPALGQGRELASDAWRAFDSSGETGWRSAGYDAKGQWVRGRWARPTALPAVAHPHARHRCWVRMSPRSPWSPRPGPALPVTSPEPAGDVDPARYPVAVEVPPGPTRSLRLVIEAVRDRLPTVRILDLGAGVLPRVQPWVRLPVTETSPDLVAPVGELGRPVGLLPACRAGCSPVRRTAAGWARRRRPCDGWSP